VPSRVVIAEDLFLLRDGLTRMLEAHGLEVAAAVGNPDDLLADGSGGVGYLLKDRVFDSAQFVDAVRRVAAGGTAMDPEVIARLFARNRGGHGALAALSPREREKLG
jgi:DNA-binding NarL/FixJ family response regulator